MCITLRCLTSVGQRLFLEFATGLGWISVSTNICWRVVVRLILNKVFVKILHLTALKISQGIDIFALISCETRLKCTTSGNKLALNCKTFCADYFKYRSYKTFWWTSGESVLWWMFDAVCRYYLVQTGFNYSVLISGLTDIRRKDYYMLMVHHVVTISLLGISWTVNYVRVGCVVLFIHDIADCALHSSKVVRWVTLLKLIFVSEFF